MCPPFPPAVSYHQGVLSATILYEILLGKATLYAVLVSVLVLMAKVGGRGDRAGSLEGKDRIEHQAWNTRGSQSLTQP